MPIFRQGDVVRVPFPYMDRSTREGRPALVVSHADVGAGGGLLWVSMITSAQNAPWRGDIPIRDEARAGLSAASVIRPSKIATIDAGQAESLGKVSAGEVRRALSEIGRILGLSA